MLFAENGFPFALRAALLPKKLFFTQSATSEGASDALGGFPAKSVEILKEIGKMN